MYIPQYADELGKILINHLTNSFFFNLRSIRKRIECTNLCVYVFAAKCVTEEMVQRVEPGTAPAASVTCAVEGLPVHELKKSEKGVEEKQSFRHWTIRDYAHAYSSGRLTPTQVVT